MKKRFWSSDWFAGLMAFLLVLFGSQTALLQGFERTAYDWGVRNAVAVPDADIAVIGIDESSIRKLGRFPWPRDIHAALIDKLSKAGAKVIGYSLLFSEPQQDPGLKSIRDIQQFLSQSKLSQLPPLITDTGLRSSAAQDLTQLQNLLSSAERRLDTDRQLANAMKTAGNVITGMVFEPGQPLGNPDANLADYVQKNAISNLVDRQNALQLGYLPEPAQAVTTPIAPLGINASGIGHLNVSPDIDGAIRTEPLVINYYDVLYPSMSLVLAARKLNLDIKDIQVMLGEGITLGGLTIATDTSLHMRTFFYNDLGGRPAFQIDSFADVLDGKIPLENYRDKIVLVGALALGIGDTQITPVNANMPPILTLAHSVSSILNEDFFIAPLWGDWVTLGSMLLITIYLMFFVRRLSAAWAAISTGLLLVCLLVSHYVLMTEYRLWLQLMTPASLLLIGHLLLTTKGFLATERGKQRSDMESAESNKMLGLSFQSQGQLDLAFEKFRKVPLDQGFLETLYNLALDFERKRQFSKAGSVYEHISSYNAKYKDIPARLQRSKAMEETVMLGGAASTPGGTLMLEGGGIEKPKLGRYEVDKELGKGAMGTVYLGKDPKISRIVAIKTLALSQEFEADELDEVKARFFREAATAGRLSHPNIVTIYDAGEEHDLAYIAMEFLKGHDLARYTKPGQLLPLGKVISIVGRAADALDYAHKNNVVHRDIKPANIMYEPDSNDVKITDFGIARITDSSKTKTGMVMGTPSYMSPEQLAGRKVDGRSDLFSLGVMLFQMSTGRLPFLADSMAALMYKITNEAPTDPQTLNPNLPASLAAIIKKALEKDPNQRYQTGAQLLADLRSIQARKPARPNT